MNKQKKGCCGGDEGGSSDGRVNGEKRIVITGAAGFVGRRLTEALSGKGYKLRVFVRDNKFEDFFRKHHAEIYTGDIRDREIHDWLLDGACGVFHLASIVQKAGIPDREFWETHVTATRRLLQAAARQKVGRFVHCSTIGVLGGVENPPANEETPYNVSDIYQVTKAEGEKVALEWNGANGLKVCVVRPAAVYGPGDTRMLKLFKYIVNGKFKMIGDGKTLIHPVYVDDLVDGMILACESNKSAGRVYILGGEKYVTLTQWVNAIAGEANVKPSNVYLPYEPIRAVAALCEDVCKPLGIEPPIFRRRVDFFVKNRAFSIARAKEELGYRPKVDIHEGARRTLQWYKEHRFV